MKRDPALPPSSITPQRGPGWARAPKQPVVNETGKSLEAGEGVLERRGTPGPNPALGGEQAFPGAAGRPCAWLRGGAGGQSATAPPGTVGRGKGGLPHPQFEPTPLRRAPVPCAPRGAAPWGAALGPRPRLRPPIGCRRRGRGRSGSHAAAGQGRSALSAGAAAPPAGHLALAGARRRRRPARRGPDGGRGRCGPGCAHSARVLPPDLVPPAWPLPGALCSDGWKPLWAPRAGACRSPRLGLPASTPPTAGRAPYKSLDISP